MRFSSPWPRTRVQVHGPTVAWVASESRALMTVLPLLTQPDSSSHSRHLPRRLSPLRSFSFFSPSALTMPLSSPSAPSLPSLHLAVSPVSCLPTSRLPASCAPVLFSSLSLAPPFIPAATRPFPPPWAHFACPYCCSLRLSPALSPHSFATVSHLTFRFLGWVAYTHKLLHWLRGFVVAVFYAVARAPQSAFIHKYFRFFTRYGFAVFSYPHPLPVRGFFFGIGRV